MNKGASTSCAAAACKLAALILVQVAGAESLAIDASGSAQHARQQRFLRHFERENGHGLVQLRGHVLRDIEGQRRLPHRGPRRQNDQLARMQPAGHLVELGVTGANALYALAGIEKSVEAALVLFDDLRRAGQAGFHARIAELEQALLGAGQDLLPGPPRPPGTGSSGAAM